MKNSNFFCYLACICVLLLSGGWNQHYLKDAYGKILNDPNF
ncbi:hypothetical protein [Peribacillus butanolivorans]|nr:hypothetical protein [Peribacillus butanolivorans]